MKPTISSYYDQNTRRFIRFGARGSAGTIHRAIWTPGVKTRNQAVHQVHELILSCAPDISDTSMVWDLGCGIGASILYLASRRQSKYQGITISKVQEQIAQAHIERFLKKNKNIQSISNQLPLRVLQGDFCDPNVNSTLLQGGKPDLVYMIESFVHGTCAEQLFETLAQALQPGGRLIICDDFLASSEYIEDPFVKVFSKGWQIQTFLTTTGFEKLAQKAGFRQIDNINLSPWIEHNRPRDRFIRALIALLDTLGFPLTTLAQNPFWQNMYGGNALQLATLSGKIQYHLLVFEKP